MSRLHKQPFRFIPSRLSLQGSLSCTQQQMPPGANYLGGNLAGKADGPLLVHCKRRQANNSDNMSPSVPAMSVLTETMLVELIDSSNGQWPSMEWRF